MRVLVFEQWHGGHYFNYLEYLIPRLLELADEVVVTLTQRAISSDRFQTQLLPVAALPRVRFEASVPQADPRLPASERLQLLRNVRAAVHQTRPDYLMLPSADAQTLAMGALGHFGIDMLPRGLTSEATFHNGYGPATTSRKQMLKEFIYRTAYSGCTWTHLSFVNFLYLEHATRENCRWVARARVVADPVPDVERLDRIFARRLLGIPEDGRYLGLLGELDHRKAIPELLAAFRAARLGARDRLLLGGRLAPEFRTLIDAEYSELVHSGRIVLIDRFLTDDELARGFDALDVVCATYRDFPGLASLMLKGIRAGRPILAKDFGWTGELVKRFKLGGTVESYDTAPFAESLRLSLEASRHHIETDAIRRLLSFHHPANFVAGMTERLRSATGKPALQPIKTWEWVLEGL